MNKQEAFDKACRGIIAQGKKSYKPTSGLCMYRSPDGCKCAIGHLIPDEEYNADSMEQRSALCLPPIKSLEGIICDIDGNGDIFLADLQDCHDGCHMNEGEPFIREFKDRALRFAIDYDLNFDCLS